MWPLVECSLIEFCPYVQNSKHIWAELAVLRTLFYIYIYIWSWEAMSWKYRKLKEEMRGLITVYTYEILKNKWNLNILGCYINKHCIFSHPKLSRRPHHILAMLVWLTCFLHFLIVIIPSPLNLSFLYCQSQMTHNSDAIHKIYFTNLKDVLLVARNANLFQKRSFQVSPPWVYLPFPRSDLMNLQLNSEPSELSQYVWSFPHGNKAKDANPCPGPA